MRLNPRLPAATARDALWDYIESLSSATQRDLGQHPLIQERLAAAARIAPLLARGHSGWAASARAVLREENGQFPREFLSTDAGRQARSAFNALVRAVSACEDTSSSQRPVRLGVEGIVDESLELLSFGSRWTYPTVVVDDLRLDFGGPAFVVYCPVLLEQPSAALRNVDPGFREAMCDLVGRRVRTVNIEVDSVSVLFEQCRLQFSLRAGRDRESLGEEALLFVDYDGDLTVFRWYDENTEAGANNT
jgi:hypothetical protein